MAEQTNTQQTPTARPCPKDCRQCNMQQHIFCAAQMAFISFERLNAMQERLSNLDAQIGDITEMVKAIQSTEAELSIPLSDSPSPVPSVATPSQPSPSPSSTPST